MDGQMTREMIAGPQTVDSARVLELKQRLAKMGIAGYRISGLDEYQSLLSLLREKNSFRYAFVREVTGRNRALKPKSFLWRLFKVDIWNPKLPMGYMYQPGFIFDYMGEDPRKEAIKIVNMMMGRKYTGSKVNDDRVRMKNVKEDSEGIPLSEEDKTFLKIRNYQRLAW